MNLTFQHPFTITRASNPPAKKKHSITSICQRNNKKYLVSQNTLPDIAHTLSLSSMAETGKPAIMNLPVGSKVFVEETMNFLQKNMIY